MGFGTSIVLLAVGAILRFAVSVTTTGFNLHTIGLILMIVGALALVLPSVFWSSWGGFSGASGGYRRQRRVTQDGAGGYVEEERADALSRQRYAGLGKEGHMAIALPLAFAVLGYGLIGILVVIALVVLIVRML